LRQTLGPTRSTRGLNDAASCPPGVELSTAQFGQIRQFMTNRQE
jgi:hypothetical protein